MIGPPMISRWLQNRDRASAGVGNRLRRSRCDRSLEGESCGGPSAIVRRADRRCRNSPGPALSGRLTGGDGSSPARTTMLHRISPLKLRSGFSRVSGIFARGDRLQQVRQSCSTHGRQGIFLGFRRSNSLGPFRHRFRARRRVCQVSNYVIVPPVGWCRGLRAPITDRHGTVAPAGYLDERSHLNGALVLPSQRGSLWTI